MNLQKVRDPRFQAKWIDSGAMAPVLVAIPIKNGAVRCPTPGCGRFMKKNGGVASCKCGTRAKISR